MFPTRIIYEMLFNPQVGGHRHVIRHLEHAEYLIFMNFMIKGITV